MAQQLFPPVIASSMPAFIYTEPIRVYFGLSNYNNFTDINHVQITVRHQTTNRNALSTAKWANAIMISPIYIDEDKDSDDKYYVIIDPTNLTEGFETGINYKVQLRFSSVAVSYTGAGPSAEWFRANQTNFSEWSTVCLIRGILSPSFGIMDLVEDEVGQQNSTSLSAAVNSFIGYYNTAEENESLKYWRIKVYEVDEDENLVGDSDRQTVNSFDFSKSFVFEYVMPYELKSGTNYKVTLDIESRNGYSQQKVFHFLAISYSEETLDATINAEANYEEGYVVITLSPRDGSRHENLNVTMRRTSSESNFTVWEDIGNKTFINQTLNMEYYDCTVESGVFYIYGAQVRDNRGRRGVLIRTTPIYVEFEQSFLIEHGGPTKNDIKQLKLKYDFQISNMKTNVFKSKTDTIGSKYPYIRRNGKVYYRSFPISGMITWYMDENEELFETNANLFDNEVTRYNNYRNGLELNTVFDEDATSQHFDSHYDYVKEKNFRRRVEEFLYNNKIKLFKSETEGNILVELMDVSLTPNQTLHRMIYTFSATAYEVAEASIKNINAFGIQEIGTYSNEIQFSESIIGQVNNVQTLTLDNGEVIVNKMPYTAGYNIMLDIRDRYGFGQTEKGVKVVGLKLSYLRIEVESPHYLIDTAANPPTPLDDIIEDGTWNTPNDDTVLGTVVTIDGTPIIIPSPNYIYEMKGANVSVVNEIIPAKDCYMTIDYVVELIEEVDYGNIASILNYSTINAQLYGRYNYNTNILNQIKFKHQREKTSYYYRLVAIDSLNIEADPGTVFYIRTSSMTKRVRMVIGETGELFLAPENDEVIDQIYTGGLCFVDDNEVTNEHGHHMKWVTSQDKPFEGYSYNDNGTVKIFHNNTWYTATKIQDGVYDIPCDSEALYYYQMQVVKGIY